MPADDPKRALADDPEFRASLESLDRGLGGEDQRPDDAADNELPDLDRGMRVEAPPAGSTGHPAAAIPRSAARPGHAPGVPSAPYLALEGGRRPLLDLFPLPDSRAARSLEPLSARAPLPAPRVEDTVTYETFYGLNERAFSQSTDPRFFYHSTPHDHVAQEMLGAIGRHEGMVVVTGDQGLGKTTLCRAVIDQLDRRTLTSLVADRFDSIDDLIKTLLSDFGVISHDDMARGTLASASRADLVAALHGFLVSLAPLDAFAVVILDDAHLLPIEVLDEVRVLAEGIGDEPALQIVLVGQPSLDRTLGRAALSELNRRVSTRCRLKPIGADEVGGYIAHRLAVAGTRPRVEFDQSGAARVYEVSGGVPRVINLLCDRTLEEGFKASASLLDGQLVNAAAEDLELSVPAPRSSWALKAAMVAGLLVLILVGAAAAAFVFRSDLSALLGEWQNTPSFPAPPKPGVPAPISPTPPPR